MEKEEQIIAELKAQLPKSDAQQRKTWAKRIVDNNLKIKRLSSLLLSDYKIATRFSWLLSDIGEYSNSFLEAGLPHLWAMRKEVKTFQFESCFVTYWSLCGIPEEQEGIALDGIFQRLVSPDVKVHSKSQIVPLLFKLSQKYPEIKPELISCLEDQLDKNSKAFKTKVLKYLQRLKSSKFD